jgi:hypothetical protein
VLLPAPVVSLVFPLGTLVALPFGLVATVVVAVVVAPLLVGVGVTGSLPLFVVGAALVLVAVFVVAAVSSLEALVSLPRVVPVELSSLVSAPVSAVLVSPSVVSPVSVSLPPLSTGTVPVNPVCPSGVRAKISVPSRTMTLFGSKSTRFSLNVQSARPQRAASKASKSSVQSRVNCPPSYR